jgi:membrane-associated protein
MGPFISFLLDGSKLKDQLAMLVSQYGEWVYLFLFAIIFCETGLVVTPFLPGDSLLFVVGFLAASPDFKLNPWMLFLVLSIAAVLGDTVNYWLGHFIGPKAFTEKRRYLKKEYLERTRKFYEKYGGKTIILARFVPIVRTFAPFVAGIGAMNYAKFILYNIVGGIVWVGAILFTGYGCCKLASVFPWLAWVEKSLTPIILAIVFISVLPMVIEYWRARKEAKLEKANSEKENSEIQE